MQPPVLDYGSGNWVRFILGYVKIYKHTRLAMLAEVADVEQRIYPISYAEIITPPEVSHQEFWEVPTRSLTPEGGFPRLRLE